MKSAQARASVETLREVQNDKALKTKAEKERRLRQAMLPSHEATKSMRHSKRVVSERPNENQLNV
jgi:hypothetical protein